VSLALKYYYIKTFRNKIGAAEKGEYLLNAGDKAYFVLQSARKYKETLN